MRARMPGSIVTQDMLNGILEAMWLTAWANAEEEAGRRLPRNITMETAPPPPASAKKIAKEYAKALAAVNGGRLSGIYDRASVYEKGHVDARELGYYLTMQGMGHGVSWDDSHNAFPVNLPSTEVIAFKNKGRWSMDSGGIGFRRMDPPMSWEQGQALLKKIRGGK
jgi:hypothetical protein